MAKKQEIDVQVGELKKLLKGGKVVLGTDKTLKILRLGNAKKVFLSSNCSESVRKDIEYYATLAKVPLVNLKQPNDELGTLCKKPYPVSVLSVSQ
ncbi:50S ribosomal protein L30e [Candidatus Woesearchaeota archaeon CG10_big_fil_rev_8_21_14_0_10_34_8]|nr:MAG: 50S ribosomal protein L30e [Candidatus Woesearchaeota archaeon CG10_big_fil_rev_8_21_14_0_10_34_8]